MNLDPSALQVFTWNMTIVVGVDGSESARRALRWAVREAHVRGGTVKAVAAWRWDYPQISVGDALAKERKRTEAMLAHEVDSLPAYMASGVALATEVLEGMPAEVLIAASHGAELLVLGSHGHSHALHRVLGSVTENCIRGATCPVVVLPIRYDSQHKSAPSARLAKRPSAQAPWTGDPVHPYPRHATL